MKRFISLMVRFLLKFYGLVLILALGLALLALPHVTELFKHISTDPVDLLPEDYPSVQALLNIRDKLQPKKTFGLVFESDHPENTKKLLQDLAPQLAQHPLIGASYATKQGFFYFDKNKLLFLELKDLQEIRDRIHRKIQQEKLGGFYIDLEAGDGSQEELDFGDMEGKYRSKYGDGSSSEFFVSPNGRIFSIYVESKKPNLNLAEETDFQNQIQKAVQDFNIKSYDPSMKMYFAGSTRVMEYRALVKDLKIAGIISGILIFLPLLIRFRKPQYVLLIFIPLLLGIIMGLALSSLWVKKLNVTTSFLFAILGGLGVETGIHIFSRYYQKRLQSASVQEAITDIYSHLLGPIVTAVASLAVTFLLMIFSDFRGFSEFGFIAGVGLWTVFLLYFTFFPALLIFAEKIRFLKFKTQIKEWNHEINFSPSFVKVVLIIFTLMTVASLASIPFLKFEYNFKKIRADIAEARIAKAKQRSTAGNRVNSPALVIVQNKAEFDAIKAEVERRKQADPHSILDSVLSEFSLLPSQQAEKLALVDNMQVMLSDDSLKLVSEEKLKDLNKFKEALAQTGPVTPKEVPQFLKDGFQGRKDVPGTLVLIYAKPYLELDDGRNAMAFANALRDFKTLQGSFYPSSDAIVFSDVLKTMFRDSEKVLLIAVCSVFFFVYLDFRNLKKSLLIMYSILSGVVWVFGVMYLTGLKLNLYNMVMIPAVMGMSIDNSIHIYHSYEELGRGSLAKVLSTTGISALLASLTNAAGFIGLLFCTHGGLKSMGMVATIGLATCLLTTLIYLPMMLYFLEQRKLKSIGA